MWFVGMLAFQLAGALILLLNCVKGNRKTVVRNCFPGSNVVERDDNDNCVITKEKLQASAHTLYLNIAAFTDLVVGYLIAAFSPVSTFGIACTVLGVIGTTVVLLMFEYYLCRWIAKTVYAKDMKIKYSELEENGVDTIITNREIEDMFNDVFKN